MLSQVCSYFSASWSNIAILLFKFIYLLLQLHYFFLSRKFSTNLFVLLQGCSFISSIRWVFPVISFFSNLLVCLEISSNLHSKDSDRRGGSSGSGYRKDEYNWRYDNEELPEDVIQASNALENLQLDRKARNLTSSWRFVFIRFWCHSFAHTHKAFIFNFITISVVGLAGIKNINNNLSVIACCRHAADETSEDDGRSDHA